jgi:hypothetical protein
MTPFGKYRKRVSDDLADGTSFCFMLYSLRSFVLQARLQQITVSTKYCPAAIITTF